MKEIGEKLKESKELKLLSYSQTDIKKITFGLELSTRPRKLQKQMNN